MCTSGMLHLAILALQRADRFPPLESVLPQSAQQWHHTKQVKGFDAEVARATYQPRAEKAWLHEWIKIFLKFFSQLVPGAHADVMNGTYQHVQPKHAGNRALQTGGTWVTD